MENDYERRPGLSFSGLRRLIINILTLLVILTALCVGVAFVTVFINPYISINPYPPPTIPPTLGSPTPTHTPARPLPSPWTPTTTFTPAPDVTATPAATDTPLAPTETPTEEAEYTFALQVGSPIAIENYINDSGCDYMGVFGNVFDLENAPILNLTLHLSGELEGVGQVDMYALSGSAPDSVGPSGYIFNVANEPIASEDSLWIQLEDGSGNALSEQVFLTTSDSCTENLILVNWRQVR